MSAADIATGHQRAGTDWIRPLRLACGLFLIETDSMTVRLISAVVLGFSGGTQTHILPYLTTRYFGLKAFGKIYGVLASIVATGVGLGQLGLLGDGVDQIGLVYGH